MEDGEVGWPVVYCIPLDQVADIAVTLPDGSVETYEDVSSAFFITPRPSDPLGTWIIEATVGSEVTRREVEVRHATARRFGKPSEVSVGGEGRPGYVPNLVILAGYDPSTDVTVVVYSGESSATDSSNFVGQFRVTTDEGGAAEFVFDADNLPPDGYVLVADPTSPEVMADIGSEVDVMRAGVWVD